MAKVNAFLIDPITQTVEPIELQNGDSWREAAEAIGCRFVEECPLGRGSDYLLIADGSDVGYGYAFEMPIQTFMLADPPSWQTEPIRGKGIVIGSDDEGSARDPEATL